MSVVRGRPPGLGRGIIGSIRRYWSSLSAWPAPKSPTNTRSAGLHILVSRKDRSSSPTATSGGGAHFTRSQPPFQNGLLVDLFKNNPLAYQVSWWFVASYYEIGRSSDKGLSRFWNGRSLATSYL